MTGRSASRAVRHGLLAVAGLALLGGCGGSGGGSSSGSSGSTPAPVNNVVPLEVNFGPADNTVNGLYAAVTVCQPGTSTCQTIDNVQVDTGSVGLRLLASRLAIGLPPVSASNGAPIGSCISFADNSYLWGSMATADIQMAGEKALAVPIQVVGGAGVPGAPSACSNGGTAADTVTALGANGILGIGVFRQDCGPGCSIGTPPPVYFTCTGSSCVATPLGLGQQLQNPVWRFAQDNNGFLISLPTIPTSGAPTVNGSLIFGIGTQANNGLGSAKVFTTDNVGNFTTTFKGTANSSSYIDTGSNGLFFLDAATLGFPSCKDASSDFYCPPQAVSYSATTTGSNGATQAVSFSVANADTLFATNNAALNDVGGPGSGDFDWGLPFFFGRTTFVGIEGQLTSAGTGPYWAY